jgi:hypothetical protein
VSHPQAKKKGAIMRKAALSLLMTAFVLSAAMNSSAQTSPSASPQGQASQPATTLAGYPPPPPGADPSTGIPAGTLIHVTLGNTLTDATNKAGDTFTGMTSDPVMVNGKTLIPEYSEVDGHVTYVKPAGRIAGKGQMRIVLDKIVTPDNLIYPLAATLGEGSAADCGEGKKGEGKAKADSEGKITGCGKSKADAAKAAAIGAGFGALGGTTVGLATRGGCTYYGCYPSQGPGLGTDVMAGAGIGAGTALIYELFKHEKHVVLLEGTKLTFTLNRATNVDEPGATPPQTAAN